MSLLKDDGSAPKKPIPASEVILIWPSKHLSSKEIFRFSFWALLGGGVAWVIVLPVLIVIFGCVIGIGVTILGGSLGALM